MAPREPMNSEAPTDAVPRRTVLVVDDEMHLRLFIRAVFESAGYAAKTASNGEDGLAMIRTIRPDLVSLDLMMPGQGGVRLLQELRRDPELATTRVMVVSAIDDATYAHAMSLVRLGAGDNFRPADGYVEKPPTAETILNEAERILGTQDAPWAARNKDHEESADG